MADAAGSGEFTLAPSDTLAIAGAGFLPTMAAARDRIAAVNPIAYGRTRNALNGAVSRLSPYITHGFVTLSDVMSGVAARHSLAREDKFVFELGWRAYYRHVWQHRGDGIFSSLHEGLLPEHAYSSELPADIRTATSGVPVVDQAVRTLYATGYVHNHARMWLASYVVHIRKVHWRVAADWMYGHLLDGDLASNHLSWQWVAGTGSVKPYLFNAENVARYAPAPWHSPGTVIDTSYEALDRIARDHAPRMGPRRPAQHAEAVSEPPLLAQPSDQPGLCAPHGDRVAGRDVWLVHPWSLGELPANLPTDTLVIGLLVSDFHRTWPWSAHRWAFVGARMAELATEVWSADAAHIGAALASARSVRSLDEPHLEPWLARFARCEAPPALFPLIEQRCDSFSKWWTRVSRKAS